VYLDTACGISFPALRSQKQSDGSVSVLPVRIAGGEGVAFESIFHEGMKRERLRSLCQLVNMSELPLEVAFAGNPGSSNASSSALTVCAAVSASQCKSFPFLLRYFSKHNTSTVSCNCSRTKLYTITIPIFCVARDCVLNLQSDDSRALTDPLTDQLTDPPSFLTFRWCQQHGH